MSGKKLSYMENRSGFSIVHETLLFSNRSDRNAGLLSLVKIETHELEVHPKV